MSLAGLLSERQGALCGRWRDAILAGYGERTAARWRADRDPFRNPVGHALETGLPPLFQVTAGGGELDASAVAALESIVRIRSVQELAPSQAVGFVWLLRDAIRAELAAELADGALAAELEAVERRIERLGLCAVDAYVSLREQLFRIRQEELKRSVSSILRRWHGGELPGTGAAELAQLSPPGPGRR